MFLGLEKAVILFSRASLLIIKYAHIWLKLQFYCTNYILWDCNTNTGIVQSRCPEAGYRSLYFVFNLLFANTKLDLLSIGSFCPVTCQKPFHF